MNYYDPAYNRYGIPAHAYSTPANYIPEYPVAPWYKVTPTPMAPSYTAPTYTAEYSNPSNNTLQYQSTGNGSATHWLNAANVSYLAGSYEQTAELYAKVVNLDPSLSKGWLNLGNSLYFLGRYQDSLDAYNETLRLDPLNADAMLGRGKALMAQRQRMN